jgi:GTPase SAR1 family protein
MVSFSFKAPSLASLRSLGFRKGGEEANGALLDELESGKLEKAGSAGSLAAAGGVRSPRGRGAPRRRCERARQWCQSLCDTVAWRSLDRLVFCFRLTQYVDLLVSIASFATAVTLSSRHPQGTVQVPYVSVALASAALVVPWAGVRASLRLAPLGILLVSLWSLAYNVLFTCLQFVYLYRAVDQALQPTFLPETVMSSLRLAMGLLVCGFGYATYRRLSAMRRARKTVVMVGLDGAGKSLIVDNVLPEQLERQGSPTWEVNPTGGLKMHEFLKFDSFWRVWDLSGNGRARALWPHYLGAAHAIVFCVDSSDLKRLKVARDEFERVLEQPEVKNKRPLLLVLLNKNDLPEAKGTKIKRISPVQARQLFQIDTCQQRFKCKMLPVSALMGQGIEEGFQWILDETTAVDET